MSLFEAINTISSEIESLTPASDSDGSFFRAEGVAEPELFGTTKTRGFWFETESINIEDTTATEGFLFLETEMNLVLMYSEMLGNRQDIHTFARQDSIQIMKHLQELNWSGSVHNVIVESAEFETSEDDELLVSISLRVVHDETN